MAIGASEEPRGPPAIKSPMLKPLRVPTALAMDAAEGWKIALPKPPTNRSKKSRATLGTTAKKLMRTDPRMMPKAAVRRRPQRSDSAPIKG